MTKGLVKITRQVYILVAVGYAGFAAIAAFLGFWWLFWIAAVMVACALIVIAIPAKLVEALVRYLPERWGGRPLR